MPELLQADPPKTLPFLFPVKGISDVWSRVAQPEGTTPDCLNVMPFDLTGRARGGIRLGCTNTAGGSTYGTGGGNAGPGGTNHTRFQYLMSGSFEVLSATVIVEIGFPPQYLYDTNRYSGLAAWVGGKMYFGSNTTSALSLISPTSGTSFSGSASVQAAAANTSCYFIVSNGGTTGGSFYFTPGGSTYRRLITSPFTLGPRCIASWRNRLVLAATSDGDPQNVYFSRAGNSTDFDFSQADPAAPFVINESFKGGQIGEPVTALIPLNDNQMLIGCDHSLWLLDGDPGEGGRATVLNDGVGILGPNSWTMSDTGDVYFVGTTGFCKLQRGSMALENLSAERYASYFKGLGITGRYLTMQWDVDRHGCWIFNSSTTVNTTNTHLWWDERTQGLFPQRLPNGVGPTASVAFDDPTLGRQILFGGWVADAGGNLGAKLRKFTDTVASDDGTAINNYVWVGPVRPGDISHESKLLACDFVMGDTPAGFIDTDWNVTWTLQSGKDAYDAYAAPVFSGTGTISTPGRQTKQRVRLRGESFMLKLANSTLNKIWSMDQIAGQFQPGGMVRK